MKKIWLIGLCMIMMFPAADAALTDELLVYYSFDAGTYSGTTVYDQYDDLWNGLLNATVALGNLSGIGKIGEGVNMTSTSTNISTQSYIYGIDGNRDRSVNMWVYFNQTDAGALFGHGLSSNAMYANVNTISGDHFTAGRLGNGNGNNFNYVFDHKINMWHMMTYTKNATHRCVYQDGNLTGTCDGTAAYTTANTTFVVGKDGRMSNPGWIGFVDEVGVWNRSLTQTDITELWNDGTGYNPTAEAVTGEGDLIFSNESDASPVKANQNESADIYVFGNWTIDDIPLNDTNGSCNVSYPGGVLEMVWNYTLHLWVPPVPVNFSAHGNKAFILNCTHESETDFSVEKSENFYIVNKAPVIVWDKVVTGAVSYALADEVVIEYTSKAWNWTVNVTDDDETNWSYFIYNSSGVLLQSGSGTTSNQLLFSTAAEKFKWFENPYNLTVRWNDSGGENNYSIAMINFLVNDTTKPSITWFSPANKSAYDKADGELIEFFSQCSDASLYSYNLSVYNLTQRIFSYQESGILGTVWNNQTFINVSNFKTLHNSTNYSHSVQTLCVDSHTGEDLLSDWQSEKPASNTIDFPSEGISISIEGAERFEPVRLKDRISFDVGLTRESDSVVMDVTGFRLVPVKKEPALPYTCHLIIEDAFGVPAYWFDMNSDMITSCTLDCADTSHCRAVGVFSSRADSLSVDSVGEVNRYNETRYFSVYDSSAFSINWSRAGIECGERYPDNVHNLSFTAEDISDCVLHINDRLFDAWDGDCENITVETDIGRQYIRLDALDNLNNNFTDYCTIWTDKINQETGDFMWIIILGVIWAFLVFMAFRNAPALSIAGGVFGIFVSYELMAYSMWLALIFFVFNVVIIFKK